MHEQVEAEAEALLRDGYKSTSPDAKEALEHERVHTGVVSNFEAQTGTGPQRECASTTGTMQCCTGVGRMCSLVATNASRPVPGEVVGDGSRYRSGAGDEPVLEAVLEDDIEGVVEVHVEG